MAILNHEHTYMLIDYFPNQRFLSKEEKIKCGLPRTHEIYTFKACSAEGCTAVEVVDQSNNDFVYVVDLNRQIFPSEN